MTDRPSPAAVAAMKKVRSAAAQAVMDPLQPRPELHLEIDLHGRHPHDDDLHEVISGAIRNAHEQGAARLTLIHGHGHNRPSHGRAAFVNTNTGWLGQTVRSYLRNDSDLRQWMLAKIDVSHDGSTTVRLRPKKPGS